MPLKFKADYRTYKRYFVNVQHLYKRRDVVVYTGLTLSLLAIAFFGLFALRPTIATIAALIKEIDQKREIEVKLEKKLETLRTASTNYSLVADARVLVEETLPEKPYLAQLVYQLEGLAQELGLAINSLGFDEVALLGKRQKAKPKKIAGPSEIAFSISLTGNYPALSSFLASLEELRRTIKVTSFGFSMSQKEEIEIIRLSITGKAHFGD